MFLGRLAGPTIATKCKHDSLDADGSSNTEELFLRVPEAYPELQG
jgi:hypothetical protein